MKTLISGSNTHLIRKLQFKSRIDHHKMGMYHGMDITGSVTEWPRCALAKVFSSTSPKIPGITYKALPHTDSSAEGTVRAHLIG